MATKQRGSYRSLIVPLCSGVLVAALIVGGISDAAPPTTSVTIVNPSSSPVPVSVQGTGNVTVTNPASNPVQTQNVGGGAATQVGQPASRVVNLSCTWTASNNTPCSSNGSAFTVPSGEALVMTGVQWVISASLAGQGNYKFLFITTSAGAVTEFGAPVDANGAAAGEVNLTSGISVPPGSAVTLVAQSGGPLEFAEAFIQGYLVSNQ